MIGMTVCSGIGAPEVSAPWIDWRYQSEIEPFPCAVLRERFPDAINLGDMTKFQEWPDATVDVLAGGTPCQSFSVAGLRKGLADPRGNLALTYLAIAAKYLPRWLVWENVPGVLSSTSHDAPDPCPPSRDLDGDDGPEDGSEIVVEDEYDADETHALWCFMAGATQLGYHGGFRVVDAQYVRTPGYVAAVPQRRRRLFFVGYLGDWRPAAAVLFEPEGMQGHPAPRRKAGQIAPTIPSRSTGGGDLGTDFDCDGGLIPSVANPLTARMHKGINTTLDEGQTPIPVAHAQRGEGFDASEDGTGRGTPLVPVAFGAQNSAAQGDDVCHDHSPPLSCTRTPAVAFSCKDYGGDAGETAPTLRAMGHDGSHANAGGQVAVAFDLNQITSKTNRSQPQPDVHHTLPATSCPPHLASTYAVRRLTPTECERLMGVPDGWTAVPYRNKPADACPDGPRYKALGNSWAVNCGQFIFDRMRAVEDMMRGRA